MLLHHNTATGERPLHPTTASAIRLIVGQLSSSFNLMHEAGVDAERSFVYVMAACRTWNARTAGMRTARASLAATG